MKIPVILLQHALFPESQKWEKYLPVQAVLPTDGVKVAVWGQSMKNHILKHGINQEEIFITGSPKHDSFFNKKRIKKDKEYSSSFNILGYLEDLKEIIYKHKMLKQRIHLIKIQGQLSLQYN